MTAYEERRWRYYPVPERFVLDTWAQMASASLPPYWCFPELDIPQGAKVFEVFHHPFSKCFNFLVAHESFPPVSDGNSIPIMEGTCFRARQMCVVSADEMREFQDWKVLKNQTQVVFHTDSATREELVKELRASRATPLIRIDDDNWTDKTKEPPVLRIETIDTDKPSQEHRGYEFL